MHIVSPLYRLTLLGSLDCPAEPVHVREGKGQKKTTHEATRVSSRIQQVGPINYTELDLSLSETESESKLERIEREEKREEERERREARLLTTLKEAQLAM